MFDVGSRSRSSSASSGRGESPPDHHAIQFAISLPRSDENHADKTYKRRDQDGEEVKGRRRRPRRHDDQYMSLCFHDDWTPTKGTLELHFSSEGIQTCLAGQQPPPHTEDARVLTLECNRITFPTDSSSSSSSSSFLSPFRLHIWILVGVGVYLAGITLVMMAVEIYICWNRSVLLSMEPRWREIPLSAEVGRIALLYSDAALSLVDLGESATSLLSSLRENVSPLCRHAGVLTHSIESVCSEYDTVLTEAVGTLAGLQIQASSRNVAGAMDGFRVKGLLSCWNEMELVEEGTVFSCVAELLQRWRDIDSNGLLCPAVEEAGRIEGQLRDMRARQDWIVEPFEEMLRSAASATIGVKKDRVVPRILSVLVSTVRNEIDTEYNRLMGRMVQWREAMELAGAERALLEADLLVLAGAEWVSWPGGHAVLWKFPAMERMVSDLEVTIKALGSKKRGEEGQQVYI